ncbi:MAG: M23 family metallopeptidase [Syntrophomonadaceae bacterium]|nr:M23 family metallopeptidase [Syntrophomonadaceae bacterium]MDD3022278.1 M23 family metallopeptidase [Syntrophomonadaceae bacterium]
MINKYSRGEIKMLKSFKLRLLLVIFIVAFVGLALQSGNTSRSLVEPVIKYVLTDYGVEKNIVNWIDNWRQIKSEISVPAESRSTLQIPCEYISIEKGYGWQWETNDKKQVFIPGVYLGVKDNTLVKPVLAGQVVELSNNEKGRTLLIKHNENLFSLYGGLKEILVEEGSQVEANQILGKTGENLYLEIRNREGPQNPQQLFE